MIGSAPSALHSVRSYVWPGLRTATLLRPTGRSEGGKALTLSPLCPSPQVEECVLNLGKFHNIVRLVAFCPFASSQVALENVNAVSEGE